MKHPKHLYRFDDNERFTLQPDGLYTMDSAMMHNPHRYTYEKLSSCGFSLKFITKPSAKATEAAKEIIRLLVGSVMIENKEYIVETIARMIDNVKK